MGLDFPVPSFCEPREPQPGDPHNHPHDHPHNHPHNCKATSDGEYEGWEIPKGSLLQISPHGRLLSVVLSRETDWFGVPYAPHHPVEFLGGEPRRGILGHDVELDAIPLQGGAPVSVARVEDALFVYGGTFSRDHWMDGFPCAKGTPFTRAPDLSLESFQPFEPIDVGGLLLSAFAEVRFQDTRRGRRLWYGTLARAATIAGIPCAAGHLVYFDPEGQLSQATLERALDAQGGSSRWAAGTEVHLLGGIVTAGTLAEPSRFRGFPCAAGPIRFEDRGRMPVEFVLAEARSVDGYPCRAGSRVRRRIDPHYELGAPFKSHGARFDVGDVVTSQSFRDGEPWPTIILGAPRTIAGIELPTGSKVQLVGTFLRTLVLEPSARLRLADRTIPAGSHVVLGLFGRVKEVIAPSPSPATYREPADGAR